MQAAANACFACIERPFRAVRLFREASPYVAHRRIPAAFSIILGSITTAGRLVSSGPLVLRPAQIKNQLRAA
jgi:hypothetical protein